MITPVTNQDFFTSARMNRNTAIQSTIITIPPITFSMILDRFSLRECNLKVGYQFAISSFRDDEINDSPSALIGPECARWRNESLPEQDTSDSLTQIAHDA